jgi:hypothetical protein
MPAQMRNVPLNDRREATPLKVVADPLIAVQGMHGGRMIPVLIIDTTERPDLEEMVRVHTFLAPGDVISTWGFTDKRRRKPLLLLQFSQPVQATAIIDFNMPAQAAVIDAILRARAVYFQPGRPGDRAANSLENQRILAEIHAGEFADDWDDLYASILTQDLVRSGMRRRDARQGARDIIAKLRKVTDIRFSE